MDRIDTYATHEYEGYHLRAGHALPFGATLVPGGVNFSIYSTHATSCTLVLFEKGEPEPLVEIPFLREFRIGDVYAMTVFGLDYENIEYGFRMDGPWDPVVGHRFDKSKVLMDPYAKVIGGRDVWGVTPDWGNMYPHRARPVLDDFDWEDDTPLETPIEDWVVYEAHVRSFTKHPSSGVKAAGTFAGLIEKIPYLKSLGVNCLELLPIYEFDEFENSRLHPTTGEMLYNYWGYSTVGFFAPKAGYAATGKYGMQVDEFKNLVHQLHSNDIEVMLDVVFNHTAEGDQRGPYISFRGIDNQTYYMLTPEGYYFNFSGTGNTLNCNNPIVRNMVLDCLRYWAAEYHIDGFRFDLAAILGRAPHRAPLANPPQREGLADAPHIAKCKLIAQAWDAGGLYQVGSFPAYGRWAEWNGKYRDAVRKFIKGEGGLIGEIAQRVQGSPDLYYSRGPTASVNFLTAHDGFTLMDMVSYNEKHNWDNGENNNDGANDNNSWNCGVEGPTDDPWINDLRHRQIKNALVILLTSQGVPMILMGDEVGKTQNGNNNTYCHDNELNWLDWALLEKNADLLRFTSNLIAFRHAHPVLRNRNFLSHSDYLNTGIPDMSFHGTQPWQPDWSNSSCHTLAFMLGGDYAKGGRDSHVYVAMNMYWDSVWFTLPSLPDGLKWYVSANTGVPSPEDSWALGSEPLLSDQNNIVLGSRSVIILVGR